MGLVFLIPFLFFYKKDLISSSLLRRLFIVFLLASTVAVFGWVMVASGLVERPWVNAYKLSMHLGLAMVLILYLFDTWLHTKGTELPLIRSKGSMLFLLSALVFLLPIQILAGGIISGMRAALIFPTWPKIGTEWIPSILFQSDNWNRGHFMMYDKDLFMPTLIHFIHRSMGYIISILVILYAVVSFRNKLFTGSQIFILVLVLVQVLLGVYVLINSVGEIPLWLGVAHQLVAFILLLFVYYLYKFSKVI
jgi:cytochrome c oxidase assembly protein subunit 15